MKKQRSIESYLTEIDFYKAERERVRLAIEEYTKEHKKELRKLTRKINNLETCLARFRNYWKWR